MNRLPIGCAAAGAAILCMGTAAAQTAVPPSVDPGRVQQQVQPPKPEQRTPDIVEPDMPDNVPPEAAANTRLTLSAIVVDGSSIYGASDFHSLTQPLIGHEIRLTEVFALADRITVRYRNQGYILSRAVVPAQKIDNGVLHLRIVEGYVHTVAVQGPHSDLIEKYGAAIAASKPLRREVLERYLLLMNALPGVTARAVLEPSQGATGGTDLTIVATQKTVDGFVNVDNRGSRYLGPLEASAGVGFNNVFGLGERTSIDYATDYPSAGLHEH